MRQFNVNRRMLSIILCIVLICTFTLSIAYAALSAVLTINGNAEVVASNWNIHLDNPRVSSGSVTKTLPVISGNTMTFSSSLVDPGDFYEFVVDVVNEGTIDAMIDSVSVTPTLTDSQKKYLRYEVTYQNGESISSKQTLRKGSSMPIKVRVEFRSDIPVSDLPSTATSLNHKVTLIYSQSDGVGSDVTNDGASVVLASGDINEIGTIVTIGTEKFYTIGTEGDNVKLFSMFNLNLGNICSSASSCTPIENSTGLQDEMSLGVLYDETNTAIYPSKGTIKFSTGMYWGISTVKYVYDSNSTLYNYIENYKKILEKNGISIVEARPIKEEEVLELGCLKSDVGCLDGPLWLYNTSYWLGTSFLQITVKVIHSNGKYLYAPCTNETSFGVRPVIIIPKNIIANKAMIEFIVDGRGYTAKEGMTWAEWVDSEFDSDDRFGIDGEYIGHFRIDDTDEFYEAVTYNDGTDDNVWNHVGINDTIIAGYTYFSG